MGKKNALSLKVLSRMYLQEAFRVCFAAIFTRGQLHLFSNEKQTF